MKSRVNLRCSACGWYTSRAPKADGDYGRCYWCPTAMKVPTSRVFFRSAHPTAPELLPPKPPPPRYPNQWATWPELVAADLQRVEDGEPSQLFAFLADGGST